jgi:hypothetical protein
MRPAPVHSGGKDWCASCLVVPAAEKGRCCRFWRQRRSSLCTIHVHAPPGMAHLAQPAVPLSGDAGCANAALRAQPAPQCRKTLFRTDIFPATFRGTMRAVQYWGATRAAGPATGEPGRRRLPVRNCGAQGWSHGRGRAAAIVSATRRSGVVSRTVGTGLRAASPTVGGIAFFGHPVLSRQYVRAKPYGQRSH